MGRGGQSNTEKDTLFFAHLTIFSCFTLTFSRLSSTFQVTYALSLKDTVVDKGHCCPTFKTRHVQQEAMARKREQNMDGFGKSSKLDNVFAKVLRKRGDGKREPKKKRSVEKAGKEEVGGSKQRRSARLRGGKPDDCSLIIGEARSKKRRDKLELIVDQGLRRRKKEKKRKDEEDAVQVFRIHVGAGGEEQLREHLRGDGDTVMQVKIGCCCSRQTNKQTNNQTNEC